MKRTLLIFLAICVFATSFGSSGFSTSSVKKASEVYLPVGTNGQKISLLDLSKMSVKNYEKISGNHLSLFEKVRFKIAQKKLRNTIHSDGTLDLKKVQKFSTKEDSGKSQLIALLLVIFVGGLGIHRFYLGYTWQGIVQLLTLGGCGIWALIDMIRIISGDLQPKNGDYEKTL
jgi:TM2 domain